jgi:catechol 2,3-dioxygenase-like lactoylglutathione lyase family enzyme
MTPGERGLEVLSSRVLLRPRDLEGGIAFYRDVLGLAVYREYGEPGRPHGVVFFFCGGFLEVSGSSPEPGPEKIELWLQVRDVDAVHRRFEEAGIRVVEEPVDKSWGLREMRALDPDGVRLVVVQIPEDHPLRRDQRPT